MKPVDLYCHVCKKHTPHQHLVATYATRCTICHTQTSQLERSHVENLHYQAPDGTDAIVVENTPEAVTFYIPTGEHKGYYYYNKHTKEQSVKRIQGKIDGQ